MRPALTWPDDRAVSPPASDVPSPHGFDKATSSAIQNGLWFLEKADSTSASSTVCLAYQVTGELDLDALRAAWQAVCARHRMLRTTFAERAGVPVPVVAADGAPLVLADFVEEPEAVADWAREQAAAPLRMSEGLARLAVAKFGEWDHAVVLCLHRAAADDESASIVLTDLSEAYTGAKQGTPPDTQALSPSYAEFAQDEAERAEDPEFAERLRWWTATVTPTPTAVTLPTDRARPAGWSTAGDVLRFEWGPEVTRPLGELVRASGTTPFVVLLAAFQALLGRYGGDERLAVGCPVSVRPRPEFDGVVGAFEHPLVFTADLSQRPTLRTVVERVARLNTEARKRADVPFADVVVATKAERDPRRIPLCDTMFVFHDQARAELVFDGATVAPRVVENGSAVTDVTMDLRLVNANLLGALEFRSSLFDRAGAERFLSQFQMLLTAGLRDPDRPIADLAIDGADRIATAVRDADQITAAAPAARTANELFHSQAQLRPEQIALSAGSQVTTYRELERLAAIITAALLSEEHIGGRPVVVRMPTGRLQVAAVIAVLDAGAHVACLGDGDTGERGKSVLAELQPACLIVDGDPAQDELAQWYLTEVGGTVLDASLLEPDSTPRPHVPSVRNGRAYVTYTSGSTGKPKGIPQTHATLAQFVTWFSGEFVIRPGSRMAQWASPGYDAALVEIFAGLVAGATLCLVPDRIRANPEKIVDWLVEQRVTLFQTVPSFARQVLGVVSSRGVAAQLAALDHVLLAGEALPADLANGLRAALPSVRLVNLYGPTESILATWHEVAGALNGTSPIGRSIPGRQVLVLDDEGRPCPDGVTGNLVIRSPYLTDGYLGSEDRSAFEPVTDLAAYGIDGSNCYRTGDLGARRRDGVLEFRGRKDFQIKFNGMRIELSDIESALQAHESVADCAVVAVTTSDGLVSRLVGYVVPRRTESGDAVGSAGEWRAALRARFGKGMPPVSFQTMIGLPRGIGGKVDRRLLPEPAAAGRAPATPKTPVETAVAELWAGLPGVRPTGADESFFAAGGRSLQVLVLLDQVRERFDVEVSLHDFLATPTVTGLSTVVEHQVSLTAATGTRRGEERDSA